MKKYLLLFVGTLVMSNLSGQSKITDHIYRVDSTFENVDAVISDFARIIGYWKGDGFGGSCEELWMPPIGDIMHGSFRMAQQGELYFSEFMSIYKNEKGYGLLVKHFNPDFVGWEEKDDYINFRYIKSDSMHIYFSGLTFEFLDASRMNIYIAMHQKDGSIQEEKLMLTKSSL